MALTKEISEETQELFGTGNRNFAEDDLEPAIRLGDAIIETPKTDFILKDGESFKSREETVQLGFRNQPNPWFPPTLLQKLNKMSKGALRSKGLVDLIEEMAKIVVDFYQVNVGKAIAVRFDGRIVESAETEIELLNKIQGKKFGAPVFVWQVGSDSFSGWRI